MTTTRFSVQKNQSYTGNKTLIVGRKHFTNLLDAIAYYLTSSEMPIGQSLSVVGFYNVSECGIPERVQPFI